MVFYIFSFLIRKDCGMADVGLLLHVKTVGVLIRNIFWQILNLLNKKGLDIWVKIWFVEGHSI